MKKCTRCEIVFHDDERIRCLYCDTKLWTVEKLSGGEGADDGIDTAGQLKTDAQDLFSASGFQSREGLIEQILKTRGVKGLTRTQMVIGNYFRMRTFKFMYNFSRNDFKRGRGFLRPLIQPFNLTALLTLPWLLLDLVDSALFRLLYNGYCEKCQAKFRKYTQGQTHDPDDCAYNREYAMLVDDILTGRIARTEPHFKQLSVQKIKIGKPSAYQELCSAREPMAATMDVICIWTSIMVMISLFVWFFLPKLMGVMSLFGAPGSMEL